MDFAECVSFILIKDDQVLVEKRRDDKEFDSSMVMIPGGHAEEGESQLETLARELKEELNICADSAGYVCSLLHIAESETETELQRLHYYLIAGWQGDIQALEAESLHWLPLTQTHILDSEPDRIALKEVQRLY